MTYADTTGKAGALTAGAVEWMRAGGGVWHAGEPGQGEATGQIAAKRGREGAGVVGHRLLPLSVRRYRSIR